MTARRTGPDAVTVEQIRARDGWACARCGVVGDGGYLVQLSTQHRQARGMGGTTRPAINAPSNLLTLCGSGTTGCHGWVEAHPTDARARGLAVASWDVPALTPVQTWRGWVLLDDDGDFEVLPDFTPWSCPRCGTDHKTIPDQCCGLVPEITGAPQ